MIQRNKKNSDTENKPTRFYSKIQEKNVAKAIDGKRTPNSGATPLVKGDVIADEFLLECKTKTTDSESMTIKKSWIEKNEKEALFMGKPHSAIVFNFGINSKNYYVLNEDDFLEYIQFLKNKNIT